MKETQQETLTMASLAASMMGKLGGSRRTPAKVAASRKNVKKARAVRRAKFLARAA